MSEKVMYYSESCGNYYRELAAIDLSGKTEKKNGLTYLPWADAWDALKRVYPNSTYEVHRQPIYERGESGEIIGIKVNRPWFDDGKTAWVEVTVSVSNAPVGDFIAEEIKQPVILPILDLRNKPIPADSVTIADANKAIMRCLTKAVAMHGLAIYVYQAEDLPSEVKELESLRLECMDLIKTKCALSDKAKEKVGELCKDADPDTGGNPMLMENIETLKVLRTRLKAVRK